MITGWYCDNNSDWYYLNPVSDGTRGVMLTGWVTDPEDGNRYYLDHISGKMLIGSHTIDGIAWYFNENSPEYSGWVWNQETRRWDYQPGTDKPLGAVTEN